MPRETRLPVSDREVIHRLVEEKHAVEARIATLEAELEEAREHVTILRDRTRDVLREVGRGGCKALDAADLLESDEPDDLTTAYMAGVEEGKRLLEGERETLDDWYSRALQWRGIEGLHEVCGRCTGSGRRTYGDTATWSTGIGGQMITEDVCDACWGTGSVFRKGADLRQLRATLSNTGSRE